MTALVLFVIALGVGLRVSRIESAELWLDEACTASFANLSQGELIQTLLTTEGHPPLYYELMLLWRSLGGSFGDSELWLRLPSLLAGVGMLIAVERIARRFMPKDHSWLPTMTAAISPVAIYYAIEARHYALLATFGAFSWLQLDRYLRDGDRRALALATLLLALATGTHFIALFLAPLPLLWWLISAPHDQALRARALRAQLAWGLSALPSAALAVLRITGGNPGTAWLESQPVHLALWESLTTLMGTGHYPDYLGFLGVIQVESAFRWFAVVAIIVGLVAALWPGASRHERAGALAWLILTMVLPATVSLLKPIFLPGRYELAALPLLAVLVTSGWYRLTLPLSARLRLVTVALLIISTTAPTLWHYLPLSTARPWTRVAQQSRLSPESPVVCTGLTCPMAAWALSRAGHRGPVHGFPSDIHAHPCWESATPLPEARVIADATHLSHALASTSAELGVAGEFYPGTTRPMHWRALRPLFQQLEALGYRSEKPEVANGRWLMRWTRTP